MRRTIVTLLPAVFLSLSMASPALAGPPWISAEYPANPFHPDTKGALFLVHAFHHGVSRNFPMSGVAEGLVNGRRQTVQLKVERTYREGVYAVRGKGLEKGSWAVVVSMSDTETGSPASLIASLGPNGQVMAVNVPHELKNGWIVPRKATPDDVEVALRSAIALAGTSRNGSNGFDASFAGIGIAGLALMGMLSRKRTTQTQ